MNGLAGVTVIAGVGSVIVMAIVAGVKMAYADTSARLLDDNQQAHFAYMHEKEKSVRDCYIELDGM